HCSWESIFCNGGAASATGEWPDMSTASRAVAERPVPSTAVAEPTSTTRFAAEEASREARRPAEQPGPRLRSAVDEPAWVKTALVSVTVGFLALFLFV